MKKKRIVILIVFALVILSLAVWVYFKLSRSANSVTKSKQNSKNMSGMDMDGKVEVSLNTLLQPTNSYAISSIPAITLVRRKAPIEISALGYTAYNTSESGTISSRISGRIEKLYVRYRYQLVKKGQKIIDIYSPEMLTAQQNFLFILRNDASNTSLINAARQRLLLFGFPASQLKQLINTQKPQFTVSVYSSYSGHIHEAANQGMDTPGVAPMNGAESLITQELSLKEGMYLQKGQTVFKVFNPDKLWVLLNIYPSDQQLLKIGSRVTMVAEGRPDQKISSSIQFIEPFFRPGSKTLIARVNINNGNLQLPIGLQVRASIVGSSVETEWLPKEAVLSLGLQSIVFMKQGNGYKAHKVVTGITYKNLVQLTGGLTATDSVAANAQFLMDSESFIKIQDTN